MKKTFVIEPDTDLERTVTVELLEELQASRRYRVTTADRDGNTNTRECDAAAFREGVYSLLIDSRSVEVSVGRAAANRLQVQVRNHVHTLDVLDERAMRQRSLAGGHDGADTPILASPMAGKVIQVNVKIGQTVAQGQGLVIVEAMKMENDLKAHRAGVVTSILVKPGDTVDVGTPLIEIETPAEA